MVPLTPLVTLLALLAAPQDAPLRIPGGGGSGFQPQRVRPGALKKPNILLLVADDCGVDLIGAYGEGTAPACTPNLDGLASEGMLFRNAWANPVCSPTRAQIQTGRHGFRTGIGSVGGGMGNPGLSLSELALPEMLVGYESRYVGKWHLAGNQGNAHPNDTGYARFAGVIGGAVPDYDQWSKVVDGQSSQSTTYATTDQANEAIAAIQSMPQPWFLQVSFNAPHSPFHEPPLPLCPPTGCVSGFCDSLPVNPSTPELCKAMVEALDTEIGRVLTALDQIDPDALVVFVGDNGTPRMASEAPFTAGHAKGTLYEGGVNVPLIVRGRGVVQAECAGLVSTVDLFATFAQLADVSSTAEDSVSMVPYFSFPDLALRETVYAETFSPNGGSPPFADHERAVRDERYKLIRRTGQADELFDLWVDAFEDDDLLPNLSAAEQLAYDGLAGELVALGVD